MMQTLLGVLLFILGFILGVWERKIDRLRVNTLSMGNFFSTPSNAEVLITPPQADLDAEEEREWRRKL